MPRAPSTPTSDASTPSPAWRCSVIDDFGLKPLRAPQDEDLHDLVAERYEQGATIVTSNLDFSEWGDAFPNRLLGAATLDRLRHGAYRLTTEGTQTVFAGRPTIRRSWRLIQGDTKVDLDPPALYEDVLDHQPQ